ncbi:DUF1259 domain-containing protein [Streptomyces sp. AV19]|uniref:DUF1259 domain-containing protein n=1 Tax=Streptomyces sp. AV19 TaxID=2793068 RepID=UPI0018FE0F9B|nr:DUF1259 domain-containing protein [Streptomyces sp. AV19]MBH1933764.1 DUF1259 domain-containing protein [Streptomyces sp. AV19]MDG4535732.1 DUF1259 domain-containing protein [Streptomyces sp. AV19]
MSTHQPHDDADREPGMRRRNLLALAALTPAAARLGVVDSRADSSHPAPGRPATPVPSTTKTWAGVAAVLGRPGNMIRGLYYHTAFPRWDLHVVSHGITVATALALGSHASFVRYDDGSTLVMGDLIITECLLQKLTDALHRHGFLQTAIHKHLLAHAPPLWWTHVHTHGRDPADLARRLRSVVEETGTPPPPPPTGPCPIDLDTAGIDAALGVPGTTANGVHVCTFIRRETIVDEDHALPPGLGATTAFTFQPLGDGRAALSGDFAMTGKEVQDVIVALRRGSIDLVELHNHGLMDEPRLFFLHLWAVGDAVALARALRPAIAATNVAPAPGS